MPITTNAIDNNVLAALGKQAPKHVVSAIKQASHKTGVNFAYLMEQAAAESSFNPQAKAKTSSATGLYQFIESTWLRMVKNHGHKYGMGDLAQHIDSKGKVSDPALRKEILALRKDPEKASFLAAEFASENKRYLEQYADLEGKIGSTELYFAHFMGAGGASAFLKAHEDNPLSYAADLFPREARANRNVFYDPKTGEARTLAGVYEFFDKKFGASDQPVSPVRQEKAVPHQMFVDLQQKHDAVIHDFMASLQRSSPFFSWGNTIAPRPSHLMMDPLQLLLTNDLSVSRNG